MKKHKKINNEEIEHRLYQLIAVISLGVALGIMMKVLYGNHVYSWDYIE